MSLIGKRIQHYRWGNGTVRAQRHGDFELLIQFDNGVVSWIRKNEVNLFSSNVETSILIKEPFQEIEEETDKIDEKIFLKRQAVEAFKLGIVPPFVKDFIFGRDKETEYIKKWLNQNEFNYLLLLGNYGCGKTHMLKYIKDLALEMNYAVAYCNLDPEESPFYKPKMVYKIIISNFTYDKGKKGFRNFILEISRKKTDIATDNPFVKIIINYPKDDEYFWRWLEADDLIKSIHGFPTLFPYGTAANIYCNLLSILGYFAQKSLGLSGLLLLFDEAESLDFPSLYSYQYEKGKNFFKGLLLTASNNPDLLNERVTYSTPVTGNKTGLIYCGLNKINYLNCIPSGLKVLFALTDSPNLRQFCMDIGYSRYTPLKTLTEEERREVVEAIQQLYISAYPSSEFNEKELYLIQKKALQLGRENIRSLIKCTIEAMDLRRHYPLENLRKLLQ